MNKKLKLKTPTEIKMIALEYLLDFAQEDHDAREEIRCRAGLSNSQAGYEAVNDALAQIAADLRKSIQKHKGKK